MSNSQNYWIIALRHLLVQPLLCIMIVAHVMAAQNAAPTSDNVLNKELWADVRAFGAKGDGVTDDTAAIQAAIDSQKPVLIPAGTFRFSRISIDKDNVTIIGQGRNSTTLQTTDISGVAVTVAGNKAVSNITLKDFRIVGSAANAGGLQLGSVSFPAYSINLANVGIQGFSSGFGLAIVNAWWVDSENCAYLYNHDNVYSPPSAVSTTLSFRGANHIIDGAANRGVNFLGTMSDVVFDRVTFESNAREAVFSNGAKSNIVIKNCYFEVNSKSGTGTINISGKPGAYNFSRVLIDGNFFHVTTKGFAILLDYIDKSEVSNNDGMYNSGGLFTTNNTRCFFRNNQGHAATNPIISYKELPGAIEASDIDSSTGIRTEYGGRTFEASGSTLGKYIRLIDIHLLSKQKTPPTITVLAAAGLKASASLDAAASDIKGQITFNAGSSAWGAGGQFTVSFAKVYDESFSPPVVVLTPANNAAAAIQYFVTSTREGFTVHLNAGTGHAMTAKWNYLIVQ